MKQWTQHDARSKQTVESGQFNFEQQAARSMMAGLDRSQFPESCLTSAQMTPAALHQCYIFSPWDTGVTGALGEQTIRRAADADTLPEQFRAVNYQAYGSGWITAFETTLSPFKGGNLLTEWYGNCAIQAFFNWTRRASWIAGTSKGVANEKFLGLRILYNGVVIAERIGPAKPMDHFSISGSQQVPSGPVILTLQFKPQAAGPDDAVQDADNNDFLCQAHLFGNRVFAIGRFR
jgi:hypothetical protein